MKTKTQTTVDQRWYERLVALTRQTGETFERLMPPVSDVELRREEFEESGYKSNPDLTARHLQTEPIDTVLHEITKLKDDISAQEENGLIKRAYQARIDELIENHRMLLASAQGDMPAFIAANRAIYGDPGAEIFAATCQWLREEALEAYENGPESLRPLAEQLLRHVPAGEGNPALLAPTKARFTKVKEMHNAPGGFYERLFGEDGLPTQDVIDQETGDAICNRILKNLGSTYTLGYATNGIWAVLPSKEQVMRPAGYELGRKEFIGIVSHEIGSHLQEIINGQKSRFRLLGSALAGMDRFELSNEGRALLREQIVCDSPKEYMTTFFWQYAVAKHFAISLAAGLHERPYAFSQIYEILLALYSYWNEQAKPGTPLSKAHDDAWHVALRICKGTDGTGDAYRKDIVYLEGNIRCWELAKTKPELILLGDLGNFNILNLEHLATLRSLDII